MNTLSEINNDTTLVTANPKAYRAIILRPELAVREFPGGAYRLFSMVAHLKISLI